MRRSVFCSLERKFELQRISWDLVGTPDFEGSSPGGDILTAALVAAEVVVSHLDVPFGHAYELPAFLTTFHVIYSVEWEDFLLRKENQQKNLTHQ